LPASECQFLQSLAHITGCQNPCSTRLLVIFSSKFCQSCFKFQAHILITLLPSYVFQCGKKYFSLTTVVLI
jgi:hypothetical protein